MFNYGTNSKTNRRWGKYIKSFNSKAIPLTFKLSLIFPSIYFLSNFSLRNISQLLNNFVWQLVFYFILIYIIIIFIYFNFFKSGIFQRYSWGGESFLEYYKNGLLIHKKAFDKYGKLVSEQDYSWDQWEDEFEEKRNNLLKTEKSLEKDDLILPKDNFWGNSTPKVED